ncbi:helix-turn-helix domain-containing protein [Nonomuraea sp. NPDC049028]|uniref:helix-turn-helix domain-containing protein n=1 Tax=Nonomuraea sp. NPDC049028 TaxID=3364348 RepID=UPI003718A590
MHAGQIVRTARQARKMTLAELGQCCGYSPAQLSRYERGKTPLTDITLLRTFVDILGISPDALGLASPYEGCDGPICLPISGAPRLSPFDGHGVGAGAGGEDDPVRRRSLLIGAGLAVPAALLTRVEEALAVLPAPQAAATAGDVTSLLGRARLRFDTGDLAALLRGLPGLLSAGHDVLDRAPSDERHLALLAGCYDLASEALQKVGRLQAGRITADRAVTYAALSGDLVAQAMAARSCGIVLRHQGHRELAEQVTYAAATRLDNSGLRTTAASRARARAHRGSRPLQHPGTGHRAGTPTSGQHGRGPARSDPGRNLSSPIPPTPTREITT